MKNERIIKKYYKTAFHKGRNAFARTIDFIAFRIIAFIVLYIWFLPMLKNPVLKFLLPLIALSILSLALQLFKSIRFERFCVLEKERLKNQILCESFTVLKKQELFKIVREYTQKNAALFSGECAVCVLQQTAPISTDDILSVYQNTLKRNLKSAAVFCTAEISKEAENFIKKHKNEIEIITVSSSALAEHIKYTVSDKSVEEYILSREKEHKEELKKSFSEPFRQNSVKKYFTVAFLLCIASFFARYPLYYRIVATIASSFGFISLYFSKSKAKES